MPSWQSCWRHRFGLAAAPAGARSYRRNRATAGLAYKVTEQLMATNKHRPRIGIPVDVRTVDDETMHAVGEKYLVAVARGAAAIPLLLPALGGTTEPEPQAGMAGAADLLTGLDGLLLTGSPSNIAPACYGETGAGVGPFDPQRDCMTLPLLRAAIAQDMPVLAVCRGFQELNVACGGTLFTAVHEQPG